MFTMKNIWFLVTLISCVCYRKAEVKQDGCDTRYVDPEWLSLSSTTSPGLLSWPPQVMPARAEIAVQVSKIKDNLTLSMFALPFVKSEVDCLPAERVYHELAKFSKNYTLSAGMNESETISFNRTFTGCYYFELANSTNHKWISQGFFLNSTIQYNDTKLGCSARSFEAAEGDQSMQLSYKLSVGLTCLKLRCRLWELPTEDDSTPGDLDSGRIPPSQECYITYIENGTLPGVECSNLLGKSLTLSPGPVTIDERGRWTTDVTWTNLREGGAHYYAHLLLLKHICNMTTEDLTGWKPAVQVGAIIHGFQNKDSRPSPESTNNGFYTSVVCITTGIIIMAILIYWVVRYAKIVFQSERVSVDVDAKPHTEDAETARPNIEEHPDDILLVYARGSPQFMDKMGEFRSHIQNTCDCTVRDVYSPDDFPELAKVGVSDWVKQRLSGGSKVVWVDTPHFRSLFNGEPRPNTNFRDNAIPYAVKLATDLFQDPVTQYCRHFVVRVESLPVEKEHADPLLVISPHKRYYIPQHLDKLCDHLTK